MIHRSDQFSHLTSDNSPIRDRMTCLTPLYLSHDVYQEWPDERRCLAAARLGHADHVSAAQDHWDTLDIEKTPEISKARNSTDNDSNKNNIILYCLKKCIHGQLITHWLCTRTETNRGEKTRSLPQAPFTIYKIQIHCECSTIGKEMKNRGVSDGVMS